MSASVKFTANASFTYVTETGNFRQTGHQQAWSRTTLTGRLCEENRRNVKFDPSVTQGKFLHIPAYERRVGFGSSSSSQHSPATSEVAGRRLPPSLHRSFSTPRVPAGGPDYRRQSSFLMAYLQASSGIPVSELSGARAAVVPALSRDMRTYIVS